MKIFCRAWCVFLVLFAATAAHAALSDEDEATFGDYAPTTDDDLIQYIPKYTVRLGFRGLAGATAGFSGSGLLSSSSLMSDPNAVNVARYYHDGYVVEDRRTITDGSGTVVSVPNDGLTNAWSATSSSQVEEHPGFVAMHGYDARTADTSTHEKDPGTSLGVEVSFMRDMGKLAKTRITWGFIGGVSANQFNSHTRAVVDANVTTNTDLFYLYGQTIPASSFPYTAPSLVSSADTSVLIANKPIRITPVTQLVTGAVTTDWRLRGAYLTFRGGPTVTIPIGSKFSASMSAGAVLVYCGSDYTISEEFKPNTGDTMVDTFGDGASRILPGFYVDADVQYALTETAGLYLGGVYQNSGTYEQTVTSSDGESVYKTRVDLSKLQGLRAGVSFKF